VNPDPTFDLERILARLRRNLGSIVCLLIVALAIGLGYTFFVPAKYEARTTLFFPTRMPSITGPGATEASASASLLGAAGPTPIKIFRAFLESQTALDYVVSKSGVERQKLIDIRNFAEDSGASTLTMSIVLTDGGEAKNLLDYHLEALRSINNAVSEKYVSDEVSTLQKEVEATRQALRQADRKYIDYLRATGTAPTLPGNPAQSPAPVNEWQKQRDKALVDLAGVNALLDQATIRFKQAMGQGGQAPADIPPVRRLRPMLVDARTELGLKQRSLGPEAPEVKRLREKIAELEQDLRREVEKYYASVKKGLVDPTSGINSPTEVSSMLLQKARLEAEINSLTPLVKLAPDESTNLTKLAREVAYRSEMLKTALVQLEMEKLLALRDPNKWSLLDPPRIMEKPVNKRFGQMTAISAAVGLFLGIGWALNFGRRPE